MSDFKILIKLPSRERHFQFFSVLNAAQKLRTLPETKFLITLDTNDHIMNNERVRKTLSMWGNLEVVYGHSKNKIDAINRDMEGQTDFDIILLLSDDMHCIVHGYDKIISDLFKKHFPDTDGALWLNDGHTEDRLNTIVCIGRKRYERFGFIYNPVYQSFFCDNEYTDLMVKSKKYHYVEKVLVEHRHPMNLKTVRMDNLYRKNDKHFLADQATYFARKDKVLA